MTVCLIFYTVQYSDRSSRYTERYRRRSQESDSDESPGRSDHNSSSERDDAAIDKITDLLMEIQDNMKKILERLKRLETSLQQSQSVSDILLCLCKRTIFVFVVQHCIRKIKIIAYFLRFPLSYDFVGTRLTL